VAESIRSSDVVASNRPAAWRNARTLVGPPGPTRRSPWALSAPRQGSAP
jgi:hypothetical protein